MWKFGILAVLLAGMSPAQAKTVKIILNTTMHNLSHWTVHQLSDGTIVSGTPVYAGILQWGGLPGITVAVDNDGFWYATNRFTLPAKATNVVLTIKHVGAYDRAVVKMNDVTVMSMATDGPGSGYMQLKDPGKNKLYTFTNEDGPVSVTDSVDVKPGKNTLKIIVNNTEAGKGGGITTFGPTNVGITAYVTYTVP